METSLDNTDNKENKENNSQKETDNYYTLDEAQTYLGFGKFQFYIVISIGIICYSGAIHVLLTSTLFIFIEDVFNLSALQKTYLAWSVFIGKMIGSYTIPGISDRYGRKKSIIASLIILAFFGSLSCASVGYTMLLICRGFVGIGIGGLFTSYTVITEYMPTHIRGEITFLSTVFASLGVISSAAIGWAVYASYMGWRFYLLFCCIPSYVGLIGAFFIPESPHYLLAQGKNTEVISILRTISQINNNGKHVDNLNGSLKPHEHLSQEKSHHGNPLYLFVPAYRRTTFLVIIIMFCVLGAYYGVAYFQEAYLDSFAPSNDKTSVFWENLVCTSSEIPAIFIIFFIFDHIPRKILLAILCFISFLSYGGIIFGDFDVGMSLIFIGRMATSAGYSGILVYILEYYPTPIRATALGIGLIFGQISALITTYIAESATTLTASLVFSLFSLLATISIILMPVDTKDRILSDDIIDDTVYDDIIELKDHTEAQENDTNMETNPLLQSN